MLPGFVFCMVRRESGVTYRGRRGFCHVGIKVLRQIETGWPDMHMHWLARDINGGLVAAMFESWF
jgi:hypothetical protein